MADRIPDRGFDGDNKFIESREETMRLRPWSFIFVILMVLCSMTQANAAPTRWRATLTVDSVDTGVQGISIGDQFNASFEVDASLFDLDPGVHEDRFVRFDLTISGVNWNESQLPVDRTIQFLLTPAGIGGFSFVITDTMPAHPDLTFSLPSSPAIWNVNDEVDLTGAPIFGGDFGGTYAITAVPIPSALLLSGVGVALVTRYRKH